MRFLPSTLGLLGGATLGVALSVSFPASATRNSVGTYSLPGGNPVVSGTTISSTWANNTLGDLAAEMTNSLDRQGRGPMLAPLKLQSGTAGAPGLTFNGDTDTGIYRAGNGDVRMQVDGAQSMQFTPTGTFTPGVATAGTLAVTGPSSFTGLSNFTGPATFSSQASFSNGGPSVALRAGSTDHTYIEFYADSDNPSTRSGFAGFSNAGAIAFSIANNMAGGDIILAAPGEIVANSIIQLNSANQPAATAYTNALTPKSIIKAWARLEPVGSGSTTVNVVDGFNVSSATVTGPSMTVTLASPMANLTNYAVFVTPGTALLACSALPSTTTTILVQCRNIGGNTVPFPLHDFQAANGAQSRVFVAVLGAQ